MKRLPGFRFDAKAKLVHLEVVLPGAIVSKGGKRRHVRRRRTVEAADVIEATTKYHEFRKETLEGKPAPPPPSTFASYVERHWPTMKKRVSERTAALDTDTIERRLLPFFGALDLAKITGPVVRDFVGTLRRDGYTTRAGEKRAFAPDSINMALRTLRKVLRDAVERGELLSYPIRGKLPLEKTTPLRLELSRDELRAFVGAFDDEAGFRAYIEEEHAPGPLRISDHFGGKPRVFGEASRATAWAPATTSSASTRRASSSSSLSRRGSRRRTSWACAGPPWTSRTDGSGQRGGRRRSRLRSRSRPPVGPP